MNFEADKQWQVKWDECQRWGQEGQLEKRLNEQMKRKHSRDRATTEMAILNQVGYEKKSQKLNLQIIIIFLEA